MKRIETSKGKFLIVDYKELDWKDRFYVNNRLKEECRVLKLNVSIKCNGYKTFKS